jgi:hypothetical protein
LGLCPASWFDKLTTRPLANALSEDLILSPSKDEVRDEPLGAPCLGPGVPGLVVRQAHHEAFWRLYFPEDLILSLSKDEVRAHEDLAAPRTPKDVVPKFAGMTLWMWRGEIRNPNDVVTSPQLAFGDCVSAYPPLRSQSQNKPPRGRFRPAKPDATSHSGNVTKHNSG